MISSKILKPTSSGKAALSSSSSSSSCRNLLSSESQPLTSKAGTFHRSSASYWRSGWWRPRRRPRRRRLRRQQRRPGRGGSSGAWRWDLGLGALVKDPETVTSKYDIEHMWRPGVQASGVKSQPICFTPPPPWHRLDFHERCLLARWRVPSAVVVVQALGGVNEIVCECHDPAINSTSPPSTPGHTGDFCEVWT